jgi:RHS repeat-associated protein
VGRHLVSVERKTAKDQSLYAHRYTRFDENGHVYEEELIHRCSGARTTRDLLERPISFISLALQHKAVYGPTSFVTETKNSLFGEKKYTYDPLGQLEQEGPLTHQFDSIGTDSVKQEGNQISSFEGCSFHYDTNGNPCERVQGSEQILYTYDALGRLTSITHPKKKQIHYLYDPLSRLLSKKISIYKNGTWSEQPPIYYLYDQEKEIGSLDSKGAIHELKVLGLGIRGEIGAAVAIEIDGKAFAPLHDFQGNVLALLSPSGEIVESYEISAFGKEKTSSPPLNPWRFSSKRIEEGLIFFGHRFYDPSLGRWLTPDPAGFVDGPNLYVFVLNSPLNRLDLFGFQSEFKFPELEINVPMNRLIPPPNHNTLIQCQGRIGQVHVDWVVSCEHWHKLQFTAEENKTGMVNIGNHMHELVQKDGMKVGLITAQNGINTKLGTFSKTLCQTIVNKIPEGPLFIGIHLPTNGLFSDLGKVTGEIFGKETAEVCAASQVYGALIERFHKYDPEGLWLIATAGRCRGTPRD